MVHSFTNINVQLNLPFRTFIKVYIVYYKSLSDSNWHENDYNGACFE